jgi:hypothetical protein
MSPEILLVVIGCYLFCGIDEQWYRWRTGDYRGENISYNFEKELSDFTFVSKETTYEQIIEKFGKNYTRQRTHKVIRKQKYNGSIYYFNKELIYVYRKVYNFQNKAAFFSITSSLELTLFFKDNVLVMYNVYDERIDPNNGNAFFGQFNTITDKYWLKYNTSIYECNKKFYNIFTLEHRSEWDNADRCDFHDDKTYWDDSVYSDKQYIGKRTGYPCTGFFNSECKM